MVECIHVEYKYPYDIYSLWRAHAQSGKQAEIAIAPHISPEITQFILRRIVYDEKELDNFTNKIGVKPKNVYQFFLSNCQELTDSLQETTILHSGKITYKENSLALSWEVENLERNERGFIDYVSPTGVEILHDDYISTNDETFKRLDLTKRDSRKLFVISKKIIKLFPRVSGKNTPIRGLYTGA